MISSVLNRPVTGMDAIARVVLTAGAMYASHTVLYAARLGNRQLLEYEAKMLNGLALHGVVTLHSNLEGKIVEVGVHHGPLDALNFLSAALKDALQGDVGPEYFQRQAG